ncbi:hypothetical protein QJS04_geneDACA024191 [Acorus gramineus]|uniref:Uncharacterized protein n=1 Tax=Acorus gramineus TaxID=55184 RepID=A0AAV9A0A1_ACOGR|nr:hypothetical protein QJS04_geneDACA024191 [Acorus gramineus]
MQRIVSTLISSKLDPGVSKAAVTERHRQTSGRESVTLAQDGLKTVTMVHRDIGFILEAMNFVAIHLRMWMMKRSFASWLM